MRRVVAWLVGVAACTLGVVDAQAQIQLIQSTQPRPAPPDEPTVLTLRPAGDPVPALKYRILPERRELVPGNAAVFYHRAIQMVLQRRYAQAMQDRERQAAEPTTPEVTISEWITGPIEKIPVEEARKTIEGYRNVLHEVELGARRTECDWEFDLREESIDLLLPEIQEMRSLARLVTLRVRLAILDGKTEEAWHWLQTGYAMARHVNEGATSLIQSLVATAIAAVMNGTLLDFIQAPGAPDLYWTLAGRPESMIGMRQALESERTLLERYIPKLEDLDGAPWTQEQAAAFIREFQEKLANVGEPWTKKYATGMGVALMVAQEYPGAKKALIGEGRPAEEVEAMPAVQVVALATVRRYRTLRDDVFKWANLPYKDSYGQMKETFDRVSADANGKGVLLSLFTLLLPAVNSARMAEVRLERQFAAIQCVEAVRLYAAGHDGKLPESLGAITEAPPPEDPATGEPFGYEVEGDTARITAPTIPGGPDHPAYRINYELRLVK